MAGLGCAREKLKEALELIQRLRPYPIVSQPNLPNKTIVHPDFLVTYAGEGLKVTLLGEKPPRLTIRKEYEQLLQAQQSPLFWLFPRSIVSLPNESSGIKLNTD